MRTIFNDCNFVVDELDGNIVNLSNFRGKVLLIVNTASKGGGELKLRKLQWLQNYFSVDPFVILAFPCRQFGKMEHKSNKRIKEIYKEKLVLTFPVFARINVKGHSIHHLYHWLTYQKKGHLSHRIEGDFTKFLINEQGRVVRGMTSKTKTAKIIQHIKRCLDDIVIAKNPVIRTDIPFEIPSTVSTECVKRPKLIIDVID